VTANAPGLLVAVVIGLLPPAEMLDAEADRGSLRVDEPTFDWGKVYRGEIVRHAFTLRNEGSSPLAIKELEIQCSCTRTVGDEHSGPIAPGKGVSLTIEVDTTTLTGTVKKDVDVIADTGEEVRVSLQGEVVEILRLSPTLPKVETIRGALTPLEPTKVLVSAAPGEEVTLRAVRPLDGVLSATLRPEDGTGRYELSLLPQPENKNLDTFQRETLELSADVRGKEIKLRVQVSFVLKDRIDVAPSRSVYLPRAATSDFGKPGVTVEKVLELSSLAGEKHRFRLQKATSKGGSFSAAIEAVEEGKRYRLRVTLVRGPGEGQRFLKDTIEVTTDDPLVPSISIPAVAQF
jgi:hypothetical protein